MYLEGVGIRKQGLNVEQWNVYIPIEQLMSEICCSEVEQNRLNVKKYKKRSLLIFLYLTTYVRVQSSPSEWLETSIAKGSIERLEHISTPLILKWIKGVSKIIKNNKLINTEVPDKLENIEILEIDEIRN